MLDIIYHPKYLDYQFGEDNPFWPERATAFLNLLKASQFEYQKLQPEKIDDDDILLVHGREYLKKLKPLASANGYLSPDTPVNSELLETARYVCGGTVLAAEKALAGNQAVNLLGGMHHAGIFSSSGFCLLNDIAIAIRILQRREKIETAFVFDIDLHAGQGTQEIFYDDPSVFTLSVHQDPKTIYPQTGFAGETGVRAGKGFNKNSILPAGSALPEFLLSVRQGLDENRKFRPDLTFLVFGADTYKKDKLGNLGLELNDYRQIGAAFKNITPLCILCSGGYSKQVPEIWFQFLNGYLTG